MQQESRVHKSLLNARVNLVFYFIFVFLAFFSRKTFLDCLGADFMGLSGTLSNILGFLSLAEMGVGTAVAYNLYKPLLEGDKSKIEELVSVFGYLYRKIGIFICIAAFIISCFIPLIFRNTSFSYGLIYFVFYSILASALFSYFINYRQILLSADQKGYIVTAYLQGFVFLKVVLQIAIAYYLHNYYLWIGLEVVFSLISCIILNWKIRKEYPWLAASVKKGKSVYPSHKNIISYTKKVFVHKIKDFLLQQSDQILIFAFVSLKMVAYYGNYTLVITRVSMAFDSALNSFSAGVGNLVAEGNERHSMSIFWEIVSLRFMVGGFLVYSVFVLIEPFITLWLGSQYVLDKTILILLMINIFIMQTRGAVDMFNSAHGFYFDTWAAWVEGILNIGITLATAPFWGISGILCGKIVSLFLIVVLWKPYLLFHYGFKKSILCYWKNIIPDYLIFIIAFGLGYFWFQYLPIDANKSFTDWILKAFCTILPFVIVYISLLYLFASGAKDLVKRIFGMIVKK